MPLDPDIKAFIAEGANFGTLTTLRKDGHPSTHVMWVDADDDHVLINTEVHRAKYQRLQRDPRATVTVWDAANPYRYVEVRGRVVGEVRGPEALEHIHRTSRRYTGGDYGAQIQSERVILEISLDSVHPHNL